MVFHKFNEISGQQASLVIRIPHLFVICQTIALHLNYIQRDIPTMKMLYRFLSSVICLLVCCLQLLAVGGVELTFELPDNAKECFYEEIEVGTEFTIEFQVSAA